MMRAFHRLAVVLRSWIRSGREDAEFADELRFHLERQIEANLDAGMTPAGARRAAHLSLGHVEGLRDESRRARSGAIVRQVVRDMAYGARLLRKAPAFTVTGIVIVALGISAVTAMFSVVYGVMLRPLPFAEPERLVGLWTRAPRLTSLPIVQVNAADHRDWQAANHVFGAIALVRSIANFNLIGAGEPERLFGARVSSSLFPVLGVTPAIGRTFTEDEDEIGHDRVALLSDALWRRRFGGDPSIVGRSINLSGVPHTVVGVMRADFQYPGREFQLWTPLTINPAELARKEPGYNFLAVARLKRGVSLAQAQSEMDTIARRLEASYPATNREIGVRVIPLMDETIQVVRPALYVLLGAVSCLLLIACLNLSNLLSARAATRGREFALRVALGASRARLALQATAEVAPVLVIGGAAGITLAAWAVRAFIPLAPASLPRVESIAISPPVLACSVVMLMITGLVAGLLPAVQAWRTDSVAMMREENRSSTGGRQTRTRSVLVIAQIALVLPLLVGAALLIRSFSALVQVDPGFRADNVMSMQIAIPRSKYETDDAVAAFCGRLLERIAALPGVMSAGMVNRLPLGGVGQINQLEFEGQASDKPAVAIDTRTITPGYFRTMGIPLIEGRLFTDRDTPASAVASLPQLGAVSLAMVDERIARSVWPAQTAIGKRLRFAFPGAPWVEVVGVVGHIRHDGLDIDPRPQVYFNYLQRAQDRMALVVRGGQDVRALTAAVLAAIRDVDPEQPVYDVGTMNEVLQRSTVQRWLSTLLLAAFASMSLLLTTVGVYGVVAYGVAQQIREFGIRMALGAARSDVTRLVLRRGAALALAGTGIGLALAAVVTSAMESLLYGVKPGDPISFVAAPVLLILVALVASYLPARRAASVDPAITLRGE